MFAENNIPEGATMPYITYGANIEEWDTNSILTVNIYSRSTSLKEVATISNALLESVGQGLILSMNSKEYIIVYKGSPICQNIPTEDINLKQFYLTFQLQVEKAF